MASSVTDTSKRHLVELKKMLKNLKIMALENEMAGLDMFNEDIGEDEQRRSRRVEVLQEQLEAEKQERDFLQEELARSHELVEWQEKVINDKDQELLQTHELINETVDALVKEAVAFKTVESAGKFWLGLVRDKKSDEDAAVKIQSVRRGQLARRREKDDTEMDVLRARIADLSKQLNEERSSHEALQKQVAHLEAAHTLVRRSVQAPAGTNPLVTTYAARYIGQPTATPTTNTASPRFIERSSALPQAKLIAAPRKVVTAAPVTKASIPVQPIRLQAVDCVTANSRCGVLR